MYVCVCFRCVCVCVCVLDVYVRERERGRVLGEVTGALATHYRLVAGSITRPVLGVCALGVCVCVC